MFTQRSKQVIQCAEITAGRLSQQQGPTYSTKKERERNYPKNGGNKVHNPVSIANTRTKIFTDIKLHVWQSLRYFWENNGPQNAQP